MVADVAARMGRELLPWQRQVVDVALEVDPRTGEWAYSDVVITVPRQAGKTTLFRAVAVHRMGMIPRASVFMTSGQSRMAAAEQFTKVAQDVRRDPELRAKFRHLTGAASELLEFRPNGSRLKPTAPNGDNLHGETVDLIAIDELWKFDAARAQMLQAAYLPTFATRSGQAWRFSTAGDSTSYWFNQTQTVGRRLVDQDVRRGTAYFEWSLPESIDGVPVEELTDEDLIAACIAYNPAACPVVPGCGPVGISPEARCPHGYLLRPQSVADSRLLMSRDEFMRASGNVPVLGGDALWRGIPRDVWETATDFKPLPSAGPFALGFDVDPQRREASLSIAWRDPKGVMRTEWVTPIRGEAQASQDGTRWIAGRVLQVVRDSPVVVVGVNNAGPARDVADELLKPLEELGIPLLRVQQWDFAAACNRHADELEAGTWKHRGEQVLTDAASVAAWRPSGQSRMWARGAEPITALVGQTLAGWAFDHAPEPEKELPQFWMG